MKTIIFLIARLVWASADLTCETYVSMSAKTCPRSMLYPLQGVTAECAKHIQRTTTACDKEAQVNKAAMKESDQQSERYKNAKARLSQTIASMKNLQRGFPLEVYYIDKNYGEKLKTLQESARPKAPAPGTPVPKKEEPPKQTDSSGDAPKQEEGSNKGMGDAADEAVRKGQALAEEAAQQLREKEAREAAEIKAKMDQRIDFAKKAEDRTGDALDDSKDAAEKWKNGGSGSDSEGGPGNDKNGPSLSEKNSGNRSGGGSHSGGSMGGAGGQAQAMASGRRGLGGGAANPKTGSDLLLASLGGYKSAFAGAGLKMGRGEGGEPAVLRSDGSPASAAEVEGLKKLIAAEPQALQKRPDFYDVLPRERFAALKETYQRKPDAKPFKHVGVPERRDFEWSQSCDKVSGSCNEYSRQSSYRRGEFVSPEDLWTISTALGGKDDEEKGGSSSDLAREKLARGPYANLMKNVLGALGGIMKAVKGGGSSSSSSSGSSVWGGGGSWSWNWGAREPVELTDPARVKRGPGVLPGQPVKPLEPRKDSRGGLWWLLAAAGAASWGIWAVKRRREKSASKPTEEDSGAA